MEYTRDRLPSFEEFARGLDQTQEGTPYPMQQGQQAAGPPLRRPILPMPCPVHGSSNKRPNPTLNTGEVEAKRGKVSPEFFCEHILKPLDGFYEGLSKRSFKCIYINKKNDPWNPIVPCDEMDIPEKIFVFKKIRKQIKRNCSKVNKKDKRPIDCDRIADQLTKAFSREKSALSVYKFYAKWESELPVCFFQLTPLKIRFYTDQIEFYEDFDFTCVQEANVPKWELSKIIDLANSTINQCSYNPPHQLISGSGSNEVPPKPFPDQSLDFNGRIPISFLVAPPSPNIHTLPSSTLVTFWPEEQTVSHPTRQVANEAVFLRESQFSIPQKAAKKPRPESFLMEKIFNPKEVRRDFTFEAIPIRTISHNISTGNSKHWSIQEKIYFFKALRKQIKELLVNNREALDFEVMARKINRSIHKHAHRIDSKNERSVEAVGQFYRLWKSKLPVCFLRFTPMKMEFFDTKLNVYEDVAYKDSKTLHSPIWELRESIPCRNII